MKKYQIISLLSIVFFHLSCDNDSNEIENFDEDILDDAVSEACPDPFILSSDDIFYPTTNLGDFEHEQEDVVLEDIRELMKFTTYDGVFAKATGFVKVQANTFESKIEPGFSRYAGESLVYEIHESGNSTSWQTFLKDFDGTMTLLGKQTFDNSNKNGVMEVVEIPIVDNYNYKFSWNVTEDKITQTVEYIIHSDGVVTRKELEFDKNGAGTVKVFDDNRLWSTHTWEASGHGTYDYCCTIEGRETGSW